MSNWSPLRRRRRRVVIEDDLSQQVQSQSIPVVLLDDSVEERQSVLHIDNQEVDAVIPSNSNEYIDQNTNENVNKRIRANDCLNESESMLCTICFQVYASSGNHRLVSLKCGHLFGESCIRQWLRTNRNAGFCPNCKSKSRVVDIRRLYANTVKMVDTTEIEHLKGTNAALQAENDLLKVENAKLRKELDSVITQFMSDSRKQTDHSSYFVFTNMKHIKLSDDASARSMDVCDKSLIVTCRLVTEIFLPFGIRMIDEGCETSMVFPLHSKRPRCISVSPYDPSLVLTVGEDRLMCVTRIGNAPSVIHKHKLEAKGWSCCWLNSSTVVAGLMNGLLITYDIDTMRSSEFMENNGLRVPIIGCHPLPNFSAIFVVTLKKCVVYRNSEEFVLISDQGCINSYAFDDETLSFMITFSPTVMQPNVTHALYHLSIDDRTCRALFVASNSCHSSILTRIIFGCLWNTNLGLVSAVYDEGRRQLSVFAWKDSRPAISRKIRSDIIAVKRIPVDDPKKCRLACLSENDIHLLDLEY